MDLVDINNAARPMLNELESYSKDIAVLTSMVYGLNAVLVAKDALPEQFREFSRITGVPVIAAYVARDENEDFGGGSPASGYIILKFDNGADISIPAWRDQGYSDTDEHFPAIDGFEEPEMKEALQERIDDLAFSYLARSFYDDLNGVAGKGGERAPSIAWRQGQSVDDYIHDRYLELKENVEALAPLPMKTIVLDKSSAHDTPSTGNTPRL